MDRRFVGTILMIGIASTAAGSLIFVQRPESAYTILRNEYPIDPRGRGYLPTTEETDRFLLSILINKPASMLGISFSRVQKFKCEVESIEPEVWGKLSLREKALSVSCIREMMGFESKYPVQDVWGVEELEIVSGEEKFMLVLFDFSNASVWSSETEENLPLLHGVLFNSEENMTGYFRGSPGFLGWRNGVQSLSIDLNGEETRYAPKRKGVQQPGTLPIDEAPWLGKILLEDLERDDLVTVDLAVDPSRLGVDEFIYILRIELDGRPQEVLPILLHR